MKQGRKQLPGSYWNFCFLVSGFLIISIPLTLGVSCLEINLGQVVYSKAGRDSGKKFIIVGIVDSEYVLVADGNLRRLEKPKKKKMKHLNFTEEVLTQIGDKIKSNIKVTNAEIRKALAVSQDI